MLLWRPGDLKVQGMVSTVVRARTVGIMYNMTDNNEKRFAIGTAAFRQAVSDSKLRVLLSDHPVVEVGRYKGDVSAVVLDPVRFEEMHAAFARLTQIHELLPLLLAAVQSGAAIPSSTLEGLGFDQDDDSWQTLNQLQYYMPVRLDSDEDGNPIGHGHLSSGIYVEELDEELVTAED